MNQINTRRTIATLVIAFTLSGAAQAEGPDPEPPLTPAAALKKMQGTWEVLALTEQGADLRKELDVSALIVTKDRAVIKGTGRHEECVFKLGTKKGLPHIDIYGRDGKGQPSPGIFKFERGELTIVFATKGNPRPTKFDDPAATRFVLRRPKAKQ